MKGCAWLVSAAALTVLLLAGCGSAQGVTHHAHPLIFPTLTPGAARVAPGTTLLTYHGNIQGASSVAWSPDGKQIAAGVGIFSSPPSPSIVQIWDAATGSSVVNLEGPVGQINALAYSPDGTRIASIDGQHVEVWVAP